MRRSDSGSLLDTGYWVLGIGDSVLGIRYWGLGGWGLVNGMWSLLWDFLDDETGNE